MNTVDPAAPLKIAVPNKGALSEGAVRLRQEGCVQDGFTGLEPSGKVAVYLFPGAVVFDGSGRTVMPEVLVEIPHGNNPAATSKFQGINHFPHERKGGAATRLRVFSYL